jgi:hypothetical protein
MRTKAVRLSVIVFLLSLLLDSHAYAGTNGLSLTGSSSYNCNGTSCVLNAGQVTNDGSYYSITGTLQLELWATSSRYAGGSINGYRIATYQLGQLRANQYFYNISSGTVPQQSSFGSMCYATLVLAQYVSGSYQIFDYVTFSSTLSGCTSAPSSTTAPSSNTTPTNTNRAEDRIYNWVQALAPSATQGSSGSRQNGGMYERCYSSSSLCLGSDSVNIYIYPSSRSYFSNMGSIQTWLEVAAYYGF